MRSKDIWADSGNSPFSELGLFLSVSCWIGTPYPGSAENLPISGGEVQSGRDIFHAWKRKTQKQKSKISGTVPSFPGLSDDL